MAPRFYVPDLEPALAHVRLSVEEARHAAKVLRLEPGAIVGVFDGRGGEWEARVESVTKSSVQLSLLEPIPARRPAVEITLVQAVLKGDAMDDVIRDATMLGIAAIQPVLTTRTTVKVAAMPTAVLRWRKIAIASAKQCGAARLPAVSEVIGLDAWLRNGGRDGVFILVEPSLPMKSRTVRQLAERAVPARATLLVGPEGGWTVEETEQAIAAGCEPLSLGQMTLRANAVTLAVTAALLAIWDLPPEVPAR